MTDSDEQAARVQAEIDCMVEEGLLAVSVGADGETLYSLVEPRPTFTVKAAVRSAVRSAVRVSGVAYMRSGGDHDGIVERVRTLRPGTAEVSIRVVLRQLVHAGEIRRLARPKREPRASVALISRAMPGNAIIREPGVVVRGLSAIRKFGPVVHEPNPGSGFGIKLIPQPPYTAATYAPIEQTCPSDCMFKAPNEAGVRPCYADAGFTRGAVRKLEGQAVGMTPLQIARSEARAVDRLFPQGVPQDGARGGRDLRLHVSGDVTGIRAAAALAGAAARWRERGGGSVWTYTHAWRFVERSAWGKIAVLASVESVRDIGKARNRGYASALVVAQHESEKAWPAAGTKVVPCPYETRKVTCSACRLCLDRDLLQLGITVAFAAHGALAAEVKRRLPVIQASGGRSW